MSENNKSGQQGLSITFVWLAVTFCVCLVTSNLFVPRLWQVGKLSLQLSGAVVIFPISYIINDLLTEVYGYRRAMQVIWMGFALSAFVAVAAQLVSWLPAPIYPENQAVAANFNSLFGLIPRTTVAELCDSLVFYPLAFLGVMPLGAIFSIILTQVTVKTLYEVLILPLTGVIARRLKQAEGLDTYDYDISYNPFINKIE